MKEIFKTKLYRTLSFAGIQIISLFIGILYFSQSSNEYRGAIFFSILLFSVNISYLCFKKNMCLFEPIVLFSFYYLTVCLSIWYSANTKFSTNVYINNTGFSQNLSTLFGYSSFYYLVGYIFVLLGYHSIKKDSKKIKIEFKKGQFLSNGVLDIIIAIFLLIGISNFIYNVWHFASGNVFTYLSNVSIRKNEFANEGTTLGYRFAYNGMYILLYRFLRSNKKINLFFLSMLFINIVLIASTGRIFQTIVYLSSFIGIHYFMVFSKYGKLKNMKYLLIGVGVLIFGILFYTLRIISSMNYNNMLEGSVIDSLRLLMKNLGYYAFDRGNVPNVSIMMKIIDSWKEEIGYLYGTSMFSWMFQMAPKISGLRGIIVPPSVLIKETWFSHINEGNLPPTGIGEMYANFGPLGPFIGMYLFGLFAKWFYNYTIRKSDYWILVIYIQVTIGFIALYPKGEFDNLSLWSIIPIVLIYSFLEIITRIFRKKI